MQFPVCVFFLERPRQFSSVSRIRFSCQSRARFPARDRVFWFHRLWEEICWEISGWFGFQSHMGLSENVGKTPKNPMVLLIMIPMKNCYFIGGIPHFQT